MKKSLLALAALTAFAGAASAQSSVTLFGVVDMSLRSQDNGTAGTIKSLSTDGNASNRLGFRGVEDLGGGMRAGFWIEGAMSPDTGGTGQTWQRRSTVSLLGAFGEIRLGRDYTPTFWNHTVFDPYGTNGVGSQTNLIAAASPLGSGATTTVRANNTIGYFLPAMGGLYGQVQVAAGEGTAGNKYFGGRLGYGAGPVNVAVAYGITEKSGAMVDDYVAMNVAGSYNFGFMTLMGQYHSNEYGSAEQTMLLIGANVPLGAGTLKFSYGSTEVTQGSGASAINGAEATQIAVGYVYDLSKRTAVYAHYAVVDNDKKLRFTTSASGPSVTAIDGFKSTGFELGVRHSF